jgi:hypothetical protein
MSAVLQKRSAVDRRRALRNGSRFAAASRARGLTDRCAVQWHLRLVRRDKPGVSSESHHGSSRQQHGFRGASPFLSLAYPRCPLPSCFETKKRPRRILGRSVIEPALVDNVRRRGRVQSGATGHPLSQTIRMDRCSLRWRGGADGCDPAAHFTSCETSSAHLKDSQHRLAQRS